MWSGASMSSFLASWFASSPPPPPPSEDDQLQQFIAAASQLNVSNVIPEAVDPYRPAPLTAGELNKAEQKKNAIELKLRLRVAYDVTHSPSLTLTLTLTLTLPHPHPLGQEASTRGWICSARSAVRDSPTTSHPKVTTRLHVVGDGCR